MRVYIPGKPGEYYEVKAGWLTEVKGQYWARYPIFADDPHRDYFDIDAAHAFFEADFIKFIEEREELKRANGKNDGIQEG